jgi:MFS family permease
LIISPLASWLILSYDWRTSYLILGSAVLVIGVLLTQFLKRDPSCIGLTPYGESPSGKPDSLSVEQGFSFGEAIHTRQYWLTVITFFSLGYVIMGVNTHLVPYLTDLGISNTLAASIFGVSGAVSAVGCILVGSTADKIGSRLACMICFLITAGTIIWLTQISTVWLLFIFAAIYGASSGGITPLESTLAAEQFGM